MRFQVARSARAGAASAPSLTTPFDQSTIGLNGFYSNRFPSFGGLNNATTGGTTQAGGAGVFANQQQWDQKPTGNVSLTWVKGNHTFKTGGDIRINNNFSTLYTYTSGNLAFSTAETSFVDQYLKYPPAF